MKPWRGFGWACAFTCWALRATDLQAAWHNVFQVTCHTRRATTNYYAAAPDPCNPCPQPVCTTQYVQRSFYQPVTTYETRTYYQPVTTYRTSYYWEPVTTYSYSCYFDPRTCSYRQVAKPDVGYRLRSQCCPVQSWVARCCTVPVTKSQQAFYWEPVTTCQVPSAGVSEGRLTPTPSSPGVHESRETIPPQNLPQGSANGSGNPMTRSDGRPLRLLPPTAPTPAAPTAPVPKVRLDRIVALPEPVVDGQLVRRTGANRD